MIKKNFVRNVIMYILVLFFLSACTVIDRVEQDNYIDQEVTHMLTKEEVLQLVFNSEYASWEHLVELTFYETDDVIGYKWLTENDMRSPMYLTISETVITTQGNTYGIVRLAKDIYSTSGVYYRTETYNEFAVNMTTGEIIGMRVYLEEGGWEYSEEYRKKVLGDA